MDFEEIPKPPEHVVRYAMGLVSGPCIAMIILGFAVRVSEPPVLFVVVSHRSIRSARSPDC